MPPIIPLVFDGNKKILVIDPSASHLAYCIINIDFNKKEAIFEQSGMLWTKDKWSKGHRFSYMRQAFSFLVPLVNAVYTEAFFSNPKAMMGSPVIPTVNGLLDMTCYEQNKEDPIPFAEIPPTLWRSILGIKAIKNDKGKRDYKVPTKNYVESIIGPLPHSIVSNITEKLRDLPYDISDVLAISMAICKELNVKIVNKDCTFIENSVLLKNIKEIK